MLLLTFTKLEKSPSEVSPQSVFFFSFFLSRTLQFSKWTKYEEQNQGVLMFLVTSAVVCLDVLVHFDLHSRVMLHCSEYNTLGTMAEQNYP